ncbi:MAG: secondary thiamine-phosphate synthase enzyme YjbQ [Patescibacteria group bacterium]|nr:secondary thiamine-phosphate synthase enzyme YjbQ [Patescibacteria group bacterium]
MTFRFNISTKGFADIIDVSAQVSKAVKESKIKDGICLISCPGSTCGITTIEYEPELLKDFKEFLEKIIPSDKEYHHDSVWGEENGFSHIRSALIKPFLTVPIEDEKLVLGQWQQIVFVDFDNREREREIIVKVLAS